jgi:hypothetical protein
MFYSLDSAYKLAINNGSIQVTNGGIQANGLGNTARIELQDTQVGGAIIIINPQYGFGRPGIQTNGNFPIIFAPNSQERMILTSGGNLGVGVVSPTEKLEVSGKTKTTNFQITSGATDGYILKSDTNGNASWTNPNTILPPTLNYGLFAQTGDSVAVSATTVETTIIDGGVGSLSVPINGFNIGDSFKIVIGGIFSNANAETIRLRVKSGLVDLSDSGVQSLSAHADDIFKLEITFTVRGIGGVGVASIISLGSFQTIKKNSADITGFGFELNNNTTFDTTISNTLDITVEWGSNNVNNSIKSQTLILNKIY